MSVDITATFTPLWNDLNESNTFPAQRPLLAHYTSISTLELILKNDQVWFSNPLYMNDLEELRFGMNESASAFHTHLGIKEACKTKERYEILSKAFEKNYQEFAEMHAFDTYILCLSQHEIGDTDGLLSMWRGYGNNGKGAAIVFNSEKMNEVADSPLIISRVSYKSTKDRLHWINQKLNNFATLLNTTEISDAELPAAAHQLMERIKIFALFTKHCGFSEEREWRIAYLSERDKENRIRPMLGYTVNSHGIEPKLKFDVKPIPGLTRDDLTLDSLIEQIILGPSLSSRLSTQAICRMLESIDKKSLIGRLVASTTPYRPT